MQHLQHALTDKAYDRLYTWSIRVAFSLYSFSSCLAKSACDLALLHCADNSVILAAKKKKKKTILGLPFIMYMKYKYFDIQRFWIVVIHYLKNTTGNQWIYKFVFYYQ